MHRVHLATLAEDGQRYFAKLRRVLVSTSPQLCSTVQCSTPNREIMTLEPVYVVWAFRQLSSPVLRFEVSSTRHVHVAVVFLEEAPAGHSR